MILKNINQIDEWLTLKQFFLKNRYILWQTQYGWDLPQGFIARFQRKSNQVEIRMRSKQAADDIMKSKL